MNSVLPLKKSQSTIIPFSKFSSQIRHRCNPMPGIAIDFVDSQSKFYLLILYLFSIFVTNLSLKKTKKQVSLQGQYLTIHKQALK